MDTRTINIHGNERVDRLPHKKKEEQAISEDDSILGFLRILCKNSVERLSLPHSLYSSHCMPHVVLHVLLLDVLSVFHILHFKKNIEHVNSLEGDVVTITHSHLYYSSCKTSFSVAGQLGCLRPNLNSHERPVYYQVCYSGAPLFQRFIISHFTSEAVILTSLSGPLSSLQVPVLCRTNGIP